MKVVGKLPPSPRYRVRPALPYDKIEYEIFEMLAKLGRFFQIIHQFIDIIKCHLLRINDEFLEYFNTA